MKRQIICLMLTVTVMANLIAFVPVTVNAATSGTCGSNLTWVLDDSGTLTISGTDKMSSYYAAASMPWFNSRKNIKTVVINEGVTNIGYNAFNGCSNLTSIIIPNSIRTIESSAFASCSSLIEVIIPNSVTTIGDSAFANCSKLTNIDISDNVSNMGSSVFYNTPYYNDSLNWENDALYMESYLLSTQSITGDYSIKSGTKAIADEAFRNCTSLTSVTIPDSVTRIGRDTFENCSNLTSITIPDGITSIGSSAFINCSSLSSITIPDSVTSIGVEAFENCTSLTSIYVPDGVTSIAQYAFYNCSNLTNITISDSIKSIDIGAFKNTAYYDNASNWENGVLYIGNHLIKAQLGGVSDYKIKDDTITIAGDAFYHCSSLTSITIPNSVKNIGSFAFSGCSRLTSITIPDGVTSIKQWTFEDCSSLISVIIPNSVTSIGDMAFAYCSNLTSITIPDGVTSIGSSTFINCSNLTSITIPDGITSIKRDTFKNCTSLTSVTIPDSVTSIGDMAFAYCSNLTSITIPDGVTSIGSSTFINCSNLTSITIPDGITSIKRDTFKNCTSLTSVTIPDSVTSIDYSAFGNCTSLTDVYYGGTKDEWGSISIGSDNTSLANATFHFSCKVILLDKNENEISKKTQSPGDIVDIGAITIPDGFCVVLYTDKDMNTIYDIETPISDNLTLYIDFVRLNTLKIVGNTSADIGEIGFSHKVAFATDKNAKYFACTLKIPNKMTIQEIKSDIFEIEQSQEVIGDYTYFYLFCICNKEGNIPTNRTVVPLELVLNISENVVVNEVLTIEVLEDAVLADDSNSYEFENGEKAEIKINPMLAKEITIIGLDEIYTPTQYTVSVLPENTTNPEVVWAVSDETVATISEDGVLTPVKKGIVTIRATAKDGSGVYAEKDVSIKVMATMTGISSDLGTWNVSYSEQNTDYTIYVPNNTTSMKITAIHNGTLKSDTMTFPNNFARTITLSSDETFLDLTYSCDGYDDNTYTITIIKFEGTKTEVSEDKKSFTITPINVENGKTVILALYNEEQFVEMQSAVYTGEAIPFTTTKTYTKAKVFVWDDLKTLRPICEAEIVK